MGALGIDFGAILGSLPLALLLAVSLGAAVLYKFSNGAFSGSAAIVLLFMAFACLVGMLPSKNPLYDVNPGTYLAWLTVLGFTSMAIGVIVGSRPGKLGVSVDSSYEGWGARSVAVVLWGAATAALINYGTGDIPLLAADINQTRLNGTDAGLLGRFWPIIFPLLQLGAISGFLPKFRTERAGPRKGGVEAWFGLLCLGLLILSGSRSLVFIPLVAISLLQIEKRRFGLLKIAVGVAMILVAVGVIGAARVNSVEQQNLLRATGAEAGEGWLGSATVAIDLALQTGPRVWASAENRLGGERIHGDLLVGDIRNFFEPSVERSDRQVTRLIGRDPTVLGGSPPTVWGGLNLDFGALGVLLGGAGMGWVLARSRVGYLRTPSRAAALWYAYIGTYFLLSIYSYVSVRPSWLVAAGFCLFVRYADRYSNAHSYGVEVQRVSRGSGGAYSRPV
ncbi:hypothetical protein H5V45_14415 [Nocardioides sp. KIGAM211]|uniref:Oligosaccharide repeat unit polymerase n=1 Tax=Nocardioides luti TaxID=2761101 RepID=A0A7X0VBK5_9ACTN|nr:hypothetical protein [Nocardioides luti]MBB6628515.1 hypothetical protein [Nocardioides luti]